MKKFDVKIFELNAKIEKLESIISIHENTIDQLLVKFNDNEQYNRGSCLQKESEDDFVNTFEICYSSLNVPFDPNDIDQAHRIKLSYTDNYSGKKLKSIIAKFRSWKKARLHFYKCRQGITH